MKRLIVGLAILGFVATFFSCAEVKKIDITSLTTAFPTTGTLIGGGGFKKGEGLCGYYEDRGLLDNTYYVAKVVTAASSQTKNQAEALFVHNGKKKWTKFVIPSHKAKKNELKLGMIVFRHTWAGGEDISAESYRKQNWYLGRISSTDELFKGVVEVKGKKSYVKWLRVPDQRIE